MNKYHTYFKILTDDIFFEMDGIVELGEDIEAEYEDLKRKILLQADAPIGSKCIILSLSRL